MHALKKFSESLMHQLVVVLLLVLYATGHMFDVLSTFIALEFYGAREGNPLLAWLLNSKIPGKWLALSGLKILHVRETRFFMTYQDTTRTLAGMTVFVWAIVFWNFSVILRRRHARS